MIYVDGDTKINYENNDNSFE